MLRGPTGARKRPTPPPALPKEAVDACAGVRRIEIAHMISHLSVLLDAGLSMDRALRSLSASATNPRMGAVCGNLWQAIQRGSSLSWAMSQMPRAFSRMHVETVHAGEMCGELPSVLREVARSEERDLALLREVTAGLTYPLTVLVFGVLLLVFLGNRVFSSLLPILTGSGRELPLATRLVAQASAFVSNPLALISMCILAFVAVRVVLRYLRTDGGRQARDRLALRVPLFGGLATALFVARFCDHVSLLLAAGIPLRDALETAASMTANSAIQVRLSGAVTRFEQATPLTEVLRTTGCFPKMAVAMIGVGESTGELGPVMRRLATMYESQAQYTLGSLVKLLEPMVILLLGFLVAVIILATLVPMYQMIAY